MAAPEESSSKSASAPRRPPELSAIVLVVKGSIAPADIPRLCQSVRGLLESSDADVVVCDVGAVVDPDAVTVDALARLQLTARRFGRQVRLLHACGELQELIALMGLSDIVPPYAGLLPEAALLALQARQTAFSQQGGLLLEPEGESEEREEARGVEEEADSGNPTV